MQIILKILSLLVVVTGAVLVYGAKIIVKRALEKEAIAKPSFDAYINDDKDNENIEDHKGIEAGDYGIEEANDDDIDEIITQKAISLKKTGLLLLMIGTILVLVVFRLK